MILKSSLILLCAAIIGLVTGGSCASTQTHKRHQQKPKHRSRVEHRQSAIPDKNKDVYWTQGYWQGWQDQEATPPSPTPSPKPTPKKPEAF